MDENSLMKYHCMVLVLYGIGFFIHSVHTIYNNVTKIFGLVSMRPVIYSTSLTVVNINSAIFIWLLLCISLSSLFYARGMSRQSYMNKELCPHTKRADNFSLWWFYLPWIREENSLYNIYLFSRLNSFILWVLSRWSWHLQLVINFIQYINASLWSQINNNILPLPT